LSAAIAVRLENFVNVFENVATEKINPETPGNIFNVNERSIQVNNKGAV
jgi:hypothetical protein